MFPYHNLPAVYRFCRARLAEEFRGEDGSDNAGLGLRLERGVHALRARGPET